jgi:hypothetical protein
MANKKISTGIPGLDAMFYGGIHLEQKEEEKRGLLILARGEHGVNKIHLAMQIEEGLYNSSKRDNDPMILSSSKEDLRNYAKRREKHYGNALYSTRQKIRESLIKIFVDEGNKNPEKENLSEIANICRNKSLNKSFIDVIIDYYLDNNGNDGSGVIHEEMIHDFILDDKVKPFLTTVIKKYTNKKNTPKILFISLNKDGGLLRNLYYDFYIQRLVRTIREEKDNESVKAAQLLYQAFWYTDENPVAEDIIKKYNFPSIYGSHDSQGEKEFLKHLKSGFIYYNGRTHGLHLRHQKGAKDDGDMLLCKLDFSEKSVVKIIGREDLSNNGEKTDGLTIFMKTLDIIKEAVNEESVDFIMVDGLSRLSEEELEQCPLNALADALRSACKVGIITADEKLMPSTIGVDILIEMAIKQRESSDQIYNALRISKCLYQKNAYGWHNYKMRISGIEVIPSLHLQLKTRFLNDDVVSDAILPFNKFPYPYWLNENTEVYEDSQIKSIDFNDSKHVFKIYDTKDDCTGLGEGKMKLLLGEELIKDDIIKNENDQYLFVSLNKGRRDFVNKHLEVIKNNLLHGENHGWDRVHLFCFEPGYIHADELLWSINRQVQAITKNTNGNSNHYSDVHLVIGDLRHINYMYPCLKREKLFVPALSLYTKKHHMVNYVYFSRLNNPTELDCDNNRPIFGSDDLELYRQLLSIVDE